MGQVSNSVESCVFSGIDVVVFDLDGTLLDSEKLVEGDRRRTPYDLLRFTGDSDETTPLKKWKDVQKHLSYLIQCGIKVAVITESPKAYASTACFLLGIDFHILIPSNNDPALNTKSKKLAFLSSGLKPESQSSIGLSTWNPGTKMLYVGNTQNDESVAKDLKIWYQDIQDFLKLKESNLKMFFGHLSEVIEMTRSEDLPDTCRHLKHSATRRFNQANTLHHLTLNRIMVGNASSFPAITKNLPAECPAFYDLEETKPYLRPILHPDFVTRYEYEQNEQLLSRLFHALHAQFGSHSLDTSKFQKDLANFETFAHLSYRHSLLGQKLWLKIKNWKGNSSGPEVALLHLEFIAICMSASISIETNHAVIVPTPSSVFSQAKPGRISHRLAKRISSLTGHPYFEAIGRQDGKQLLLNPKGIPFESKVILIDDQLTSGGTIARAVSALSAGGVGEIEIRVWTVSNLNIGEGSGEQSASIQDSNSLIAHETAHEASFSLETFSADLKTLTPVAEFFSLMPSNGVVRKAEHDEFLLGQSAADSKLRLKVLSELGEALLQFAEFRDVSLIDLSDALRALEDDDADLLLPGNLVEVSSVKASLKIKHPEIFRKFVRITSVLQTRFALEIICSRDNAMLEDLQSDVEELLELDSVGLALEATIRIESLASQIVREIAVTKDSFDLYQTRLKVLLGEDYAIEGVCSWLRHEKDVLRFDIKSFTAGFPELAKEYFP